MFLPHVSSYKSLTASHLRRRHSSKQGNVQNLSVVMEINCTITMLIVTVTTGLVPMGCRIAPFVYMLHYLLSVLVQITNTVGLQGNVSTGAEDVKITRHAKCFNFRQKTGVNYFERQSSSKSGEEGVKFSIPFVCL
jgi:hypothetical protein